MPHFEACRVRSVSWDGVEKQKSTSAEKPRLILNQDSKQLI